LPQLTLATAGSLSPAYARSSKDTGGTSAENFVGYATDGVLWTAFSKIGTHKEPADYVPSKSGSLTDLTAIYNDTLSAGCADGAMTWSCLGVSASHGDADPIDCYVAESGSGTYSTWNGALGWTGGEDPACSTTAHEVGGGTQASHTNLFENQMSYIATQSDAKDAIYFMSYGRYITTCPGGPIAGACAGTPQKPASNKYETVFGELSDATSGGPVAASAATIQGSGGGNGVTFPVTRDLYNVYNNPTATAPATPATQATLNLVGEEGFLCKASTTTQIDPITGVDYRTEIEADISAQGFFPIDVSQTAFPEGTLTNPDPITDAGYNANDPAVGSSGFCLVQDG
jgi:hypothetical protein